MLISKKTSGWDLSNELGKVGVRWLLVVGVGIYLCYRIAALPVESPAAVRGIAGTLNYAYAGSFLVLTATLNLGFHIFLIRRRRTTQAISRHFKYLSMVFDLMMVTALLLPTGGKNSMFFLVYLVVIVSNGMRYGMRLSLIALIVFNILYVGVLLLQTYPSLQIDDFSTEAVKIIGVWFVGTYIGYLSRRFEHLQNEVENYREIIRQLSGGARP